MSTEEFEDTKRVIRIRKSKKTRQHNGQKKKVKKTNHDLQNRFTFQVRVSACAIRNLASVTCKVKSTLTVTYFRKSVNKSTKHMTC